MATGKAPISGGIAITLGVLSVVLFVIALFGGVAWSSVVSVAANFAVFVIVWRGMKKHDQEYEERMEHQAERLGPD